MLVDVLYAAPHVHKIINVALHLEYSLGIILTQGVTLTSTTRLYRGYVNWG
jgi:hypothetical protein